MENNKKIKYFRNAVLKWYRTHGRKDLPWQLNVTPYRVWLSEIMLQQTQVSTVIPYFEKFIQHFPTIQSLGNADVDEVLHLWTGLGYYARARNCHKTAKIISQQLKGKFPNTIEGLQQLPGIGRSTAGAILAFGYHQRAAILDGNVKRVLSRFHAIESWKNEDKLWNISEEYTPSNQIQAYTQAMMDLGATICTRTKPNCENCPLHLECKANLQQEQMLYPGKRPSKKLPIKKIFMLVLKNKSGKILLEKRPEKGIWGGLWSLPEFQAKRDIHEKYGKQISLIKDLKAFRHTFTHFHLDIFTIVGKCSRKIDGYWHDVHGKARIGLAAPIKKILTQDLTIMD